MRLFSRLSYQRKLLIYMMSMVIFMGGATGLLIRGIIFPYLVHEMEGRGGIVARRLAERARPLILAADKASLTALLQEEAHLDQNVAYILVTDGEGRPLADTLGDAAPAGTDAAPTRSGDGAGGMAAAMARESSGRIADIVAPVLDAELHKIGSIQVGLDEQFINDVVRRLGFYHLAFTGLTSLVGLLFCLHLSRIITRPIVSLTRLAGEVSLGNLNTHINLDRQELCWELKQCGHEDCPAHSNELLRCWFVDDTPCERNPNCRFPEKMLECRECPVYRSQAGDEIVQLADAFNHMTWRLRASEMKLRRSEERYRRLFESDPNATFVVSLDSHIILDANARAAEQYGYPKLSLVGMAFTDLGFKEDSALVGSSFAAISTSGKSCSLVPRIRHRRKNGAGFWVNIYICVYEHLGKQDALVTSTDITEMVETETRLIQASKMATLGEMSAGIAHELSQPLNAIQVGGDFLSTMSEQGRAIRDEDLREVTRGISKEVSRASAIINHLRQFGRKSTIHRELIDINKPIQGVFTLLGQQLKVHGIRIVTELAEGLPPVAADENRMEQVLINLVNNARDAMEAKGQETAPGITGVLTVRSFVENDRVMVTVGDTGTGVPEAARERIFEPFFTTKGVGKGTGLGLSISYGIIKDYDGDIEMVTEDGVGTTFRISLPPARDEKQPDDKSHE